MSRIFDKTKPVLTFANDLFKPSFSSMKTERPYMGTLIVIFWWVAFLVGWAFQPFAVLPSALEVVEAFPRLITQRELLLNLGSSIYTNTSGLVITTILALLIAYGGCIRIFKPIRSFVSMLKACGLSGITIVFLLILHSDVRMKIGLWVFSVIGFMVANITVAIEAIPRSKYDYGKSLGMNDFQILWYLCIRGTLPDVWDAIRINNAMGWVVLSQLELSYRGGGGLGMMLSDQRRFDDYAAMGAVQIVIMVTGLVTEIALYLAKRRSCKHFFLKTDARRA